MGCDGNCKCKKDSKTPFSGMVTIPHTTFSMGYVKHFIYAIEFNSSEKDNNDLVVKFVDFPELIIELNSKSYNNYKEINEDISSKLNCILRDRWNNNEAIKMPTKCYELPISYSKLIGYARIDDTLLKEFGWVS